MPRVHQSTALVCPHPLMTSGAIYSSVPTKEFVRKFAIQDFVSIAGRGVRVRTVAAKDHGWLSTGVGLLGQVEV